MYTSKHSCTSLTVWQCFVADNRFKIMLSFKAYASMLMQAMALPLQGSQVLQKVQSPSQLHQQPSGSQAKLLPKTNGASCRSLPKSNRSTLLHCIWGSLTGRDMPHSSSILPVVLAAQSLQLVFPMHMCHFTSDVTASRSPTYAMLLILSPAASIAVPLATRFYTVTRFNACHVARDWSCAKCPHYVQDPFSKSLLDCRNCRQQSSCT